MTPVFNQVRCAHVSYHVVVSVVWYVVVPVMLVSHRGAGQDAGHPAPRWAGWPERALARGWRPRAIPAHQGRGGRHPARPRGGDTQRTTRSGGWEPGDVIPSLMALLGGAGRMPPIRPAVEPITGLTSCPRVVVHGVHVAACVHDHDMTGRVCRRRVYGRHAPTRPSYRKLTRPTNPPTASVVFSVIFVPLAAPPPSFPHHPSHTTRHPSPPHPTITPHHRPPPPPTLDHRPPPPPHYPNP